LQDKITISESLQNYISIIELVTGQYSIDASRIYSTGLPMGSGGTLATLTGFPDMFAAAIPICGYGDVTKMPLIKDIPILTFHGSDDDVLNVEKPQGHLLIH